MSKQLLAIYEILKEYDGNSEKSRVVMQKMLTHFNEIESLMLDELHARNIESGLIGLEIVCKLKPSNEQYNKAAALLKNPDELTAIMLQRGLDSDSEYYRNVMHLINGLVRH